MITGCGKKEDKKVNKDALAFKEEYEALNGKMARYKKEHRTLNIPEDNPYVKLSFRRGWKSSHRPRFT